VDGLCSAGRAALARAELVMGSARHLALLPALTCAVFKWPVPFADGIAELLAHRGRRVVMLSSGDPFSVRRRRKPCAPSRSGGIGLRTPRHRPSALLPPGWAGRSRKRPASACTQRRWTACRPHIAPAQRAIVLLRDGDAVATAAQYLTSKGFGPSTLHVMEALGGPHERLRVTTAQALPFADIAHPVAVGIAFAGSGNVLPVTSGRPDAWFDHDGQITKAPVRALTLSALAPRAGEWLWDIGTGSGSIAIEWLLAHPANRATAFEADPLRAGRARANAKALGVDRLDVINARMPEGLPEGPHPHAVFIGGGLSDPLLDALWARLPDGTRLVANAVSLESEAALTRWHGAKGGSLLRIELADAVPLGQRHGWKGRYPVVQWSVTL